VYLRQKHISICLVCVLAQLAAVRLACSAAAADEPDAAIKVAPPDGAGFKLFETQVRPLLVEHCYECHGPDVGDGEGGLRLDSRHAILHGGKSGPAIVPADPATSLLILAVKHDGAVAMPPKRKLAQREIDSLADWVRIGAPWPGDETPASPGPTGTDAQPAGDTWDEQARSFWAFQLPRRTEPPAVAASTWSGTPVDRFIRASLDAAGLAPAPRADKRTLLRRVTLDLIGIPPTREELNAFLQDNSSDAFARVVDRLLASPLYGERWGRHWLDVVRYADSNGMDDNLAYSDAWRYRDYVIAAFNADRPFDRFIHEQLAGDLLASDEPARRDELTIATGFLSIGPKMLAEDDPQKQQLDIVDEQIDTTCRVFMGLTMGCVRCHDHKFDPLSMADYYGLAGIFKSTRTMLSYRVDSKWNATGLGSPEAAFRVADLEQIIDRHDNALVNGNTGAMTADERGAHTKLLEAARQEYASLPKAMAVAEGTGEDQAILLRGNHLTRGPVVSRRFPTILAGTEQPAIGRDRSGRLELAHWLTTPDHPLTARVIVNRVWRWHFGRGLVRTVDNFGRLGEVPSHPELLDWLATTFMADGWSLKQLHRHMLLTETYQMARDWNEHAAQVDPENRLLWHRARQRMEPEIIRDSLLAVSGELDRTAGGTLLVTTPFQNLGLGGLARKPELYQSNRRSVYLPVLRSALYDVFQAFDFPDPATMNGDRATTTVASQALFMLNHELVEKSAARLADAMLAQATASDNDRFDLLAQTVLGRAAVDDDCHDWQMFLTRYESVPSLQTATAEQRRRAAWQGLCRALLASNEFVYLP
jgi:mono/diheme cytochrome c family protein